MRAENQEGAMEPALASLCHNIGGHARFAALRSRLFQFDVIPGRANGSAQSAAR
jgi:hypothetical protein